MARLLQTNMKENTSECNTSDHVSFLVNNSRVLVVKPNLFLLIEASENGALKMPIKCLLRIPFST